jgi:hypothetical protein
MSNLLLASLVVLIAALPANASDLWDSAVFQISDQRIASIVPVRNWKDSRSIVAATQSGPQLAGAPSLRWPPLSANSAFRPPKCQTVLLALIDLY